MNGLQIRRPEVGGRNEAFLEVTEFPAERSCGDTRWSIAGWVFLTVWMAAPEHLFLGNVSVLPTEGRLGIENATDPGTLMAKIFRVHIYICGVWFIFIRGGRKVCSLSAK